MNLGDAIRITRQKAFYTQDDFAHELDVALSTVNRWELNKSKPNIKAMKSMKDFCDAHNLPYNDIEKEWFNNHSEGV
ncbi:MAG: helix-turn-helix transcriptional regulator [Clostridiaceae bacterium]